MNMSYCRFQNTLTDLRDCAQVLEEMKSGEMNSELSWEEARAARQLVKQVIEIAAMLADHAGRDFDLGDDDAAGFIDDLQEIAKKSNEDSPSDEQNAERDEAGS